jgi:ribosomal protein S18 acetylase RimI-like enzyme
MATTRRDVDVQIVDLCTVTATELEALWQGEEALWRQRLLWDISEVLATLRRMVARRGLPGKAVRVGDQTVGYTYYGVTGRLGCIANFVITPAWNQAEVGEPLLRATLEALQARGVSRIESRCVASDRPWLVAACERWGLRTYWREFLRLDLHHVRTVTQSPEGVQVVPWYGAHLREAAAVMQAAYAGTIDAELNTLYRTVEGCQLVLDAILHQGGCGRPVLEASAMLDDRGQRAGCVVITETAPRQGHLAQVVVQPAAQRRGLGRLLLLYSMSQLATRQFDTLSLIVSRANHRALSLYQAMGWYAVLAFPVFVWEKSSY